MNNKYFCGLMFFLGIFIQIFLLILGGNLAYKGVQSFFIIGVNFLFFISYFVFCYGLYIGVGQLIEKKWSVVLFFGIFCNAIWLLFNCVAFVLSVLGMV